MIPTLVQTHFLLNKVASDTKFAWRSTEYRSIC